MFGGKSKGPYSFAELKSLAKQHASKLGGFWVKSVEVYRNGKLFFTAPKNGMFEEFELKHMLEESPKGTGLPADKDGNAIPGAPITFSPEIMERIEAMGPAEPAEESNTTRNVVLAAGAGLLGLLFLRR